MSRRFFSAITLTLLDILLGSALVSSAVWADETVGPSVKFTRGAVNSVLISAGDGQLAVYGVGQQAANQAETKCEQLLLTHHRRDVLSDVTGVSSTDTLIIAPEAERAWFEQPAEFWNAFTKSRYLGRHGVSGLDRSPYHNRVTVSCNISVPTH